MIQNVGKNLQEFTIDRAFTDESHCAGFACGRTTRRLGKSRHDDH
jgi:hypothetical protein